MKKRWMYSQNIGSGYKKTKFSHPAMEVSESI